MSVYKSLCAVLESLKTHSPKSGTDETSISGDGCADRVESTDREDMRISRRAFIKKAGLGAAGAGALTMMPSAAAKINVRDELEMHGDLVINGHKLYLSENQPSDAEQGDIWIDTSTDTT